jgi:hypothetical protein
MMRPSGWMCPRHTSVARKPEGGVPPPDNPFRW